MSAFRVLNITRGKALEVMLCELYSELPSDKELARFMDEYLEDVCCNCNIVPNGCDSDDEVL